MSRPGPAATPLAAADAGVVVSKRRSLRGTTSGRANFVAKLGVDVLDDLAEPCARLAGEGMLRLRHGGVEPTRDGRPPVELSLPASYDQPLVGGRHT